MRLGGGHRAQWGAVEERIWQKNALHAKESTSSCTSQVINENNVTKNIRKGEEGGRSCHLDRQNHAFIFTGGAVWKKRKVPD